MQGLSAGGHFAKHWLSTHPVAVTIFGGLITATLLDTFLTPLLFHRFGRSALERLRTQQQDLETAEAY